MIGDGYADSAEAVWVIGANDALTACRQIPSASVDLVLCSPTFLALRDYLDADDPAKAQEMGREDTPGEYLDALLDVVVEWRRILTPHGTLAVELGDTYAGSGGAGGDYGEGGRRDSQQRFNGAAAKARAHATKKRTRSPGPGWPLDRSLCMIPQSFTWALVYGRNPWTGREIEPWRVRNVVRWCKPNPPVGALGDKFRPATSEMTIACVDRRYFDLDAVRIPGAPPKDWWEPTEAEQALWDQWAEEMWKLATYPYAGSHYATWPPALVERPIGAMCPRRVCTTCGKPSERITEAVRTLDGEPADLAPISTTHHAGADGDGIGHWRKGTERTHLGWTDCGHDSWRPGRVLDPFAGSGTTLQVALGLGRDSIGLDLDVRNQALATERVGPLFLQHFTVEQLVARLTPERTALQAG